MKIRLLLLVLLAPVLALVGAIRPAAADTPVLVRPAVIDLEAMAKEDLDLTITLKNTSAGRTDLYPVVYDLGADGQGGLRRDDLEKSVSLARWVKISRGVIELAPGEERELAVQIEVDIAAAPGQRHAVIAFPAASNRYDAEAMIGQAEVAEALINVKVKEDLFERLELKWFRPTKNVFLEPPVVFDISMRNAGNQPLSADGSLHFYDRRGQEVGLLKLGQKMSDWPADEERTIEAVWAERPHWGRFKARLVVTYGEKDVKEIADTAFFWFFPWKIMAGLALGLLVLIAVTAYLIFKRTYVRHHEAASGDGVLDLSKDE